MKRMPNSLFVFAAPLLLALAACGSKPTAVDSENTERPIIRTPINTWGDFDSLIGKRVAVLGRLGSIQGVHATLTTPAGLIIGLPHFGTIARGTAWYDHLGRTVEVVGILHAPGRADPAGIPRFDGPTCEAESFRQID
jgi:hypothetical protein